MVENDLKAQVDNLIRIGIALSSELDIDELLEMIVDESRRFTRADGGTLYIVSDDKKYLRGKIVQNDTLETRIGGTSPVEIDEQVFAPIPLAVDGQMNHANVSAFVANTGRSVNIEDVFETEEFDFAGPRLFYEKVGFRTKSMLVVPLRNHEDDIIGVMMLLNAQDTDQDVVIPFSLDHQNLISALASQAAVGITNAQLIQDLQNLFDAFIQSIASAIDEKSTYTGGHIRRVADLTMMLAEEINQTEESLWGRLNFTEDELNELRIAAWMHDVGKITTPEYVVDKATKLETIFDRVEIVRTRYEVLKRDAEIAALKKKIALMGEDEPEGWADVERSLEQQLTEVGEELAFISQCNTGGEYMADEDLERIRKIASQTFLLGGEPHVRLTKNEVHNLSIRKGTLTDGERDVINNHAAVSVKMLSQLPFSKNLSKVPEYAGGHHEKLNGLGYPEGLAAEELPLQARIMAVADILEALTAPDRPYREPMPLSQALKIIDFMVKDGELDGKIVDLLINSGLVFRYADKELHRDQNDVKQGE